MGEKKEHSRSLRMTETIKNFVEMQDGNGFNDKFENMVKFCIEAQPALKKQVNEQSVKLNELNKKILEKRNILNDLEELETSIKYMLNVIIK